MDERIRAALEVLDTLERDLHGLLRYSFALVSDSELRALIEYCQALLALRESRPRD